MSRWHRDREVAELIAHFDAPDKFEQPEKLTSVETQVILKELDRCRKDFVYAARNYFWITNKNLGDQLFSLWPSQELILQKIMEIKAKGLAQKVIIIKARQLGCSTLIEGLIAWRTMFFSGVNALVCSYDISHTAEVLFPILLFIYDRMPWWLRPQCASRRSDTGLFFENPNPDMRRFDPGLNSRIFLKGANTTTAVGQGIRLSAVHLSEFADFEDRTAKDIIDEDMGNALVEGPATMAILESTAKGANRYAHRLWKRCMQLADEAEWYPLFLPWFFESARVRVVMPDFRLEPPEVRMREQVMFEWVCCDNQSCRQYHYRYIKGEDRSETTCPTCNAGILHPYVLTDQQLCWIYHRRRNAARDDDSMKKLRQEVCSTAEEAFQVTGYQIFGDNAQQFANSTVRQPIAIGFFDKLGKFHGCNRSRHRMSNGIFPCFQEDCTVNHEWDDSPLQIWEWPQPGRDYCIGADVAEGLGGKAAYSVGVVIRYSLTGGGDYQVATWRSNTISPIEFAYELNHLGRWYNDGLMSIECNRYDLCAGTVRIALNYPNVYRWKHLDSTNIMSQKWGWWTNLSSRPRLWQTFKSWLKQELFFVRSANLAEEMKNFVKDEEEANYAGGDRDETDDEAIAAMIALYTAHEGDWNDAFGVVVPRAQLTLENAAYRVHCMNCNHEWPVNNIDQRDIDPTLFTPKVDENGVVKSPGGLVCTVCNSRRLEILRNSDYKERTMEERLWQEATNSNHWTPDSLWTSNEDFTSPTYRSYDEL